MCRKVRKFAKLDAGRNMNIVQYKYNYNLMMNIIFSAQVISVSVAGNKHALQIIKQKF